MAEPLKVAGTATYMTTFKPWVYRLLVLALIPLQTILLGPTLRAFNLSFGRMTIEPLQYTMVQQPQSVPGFPTG